MLEIGLGFIYTKNQDLVSYDVYNFITGNTVIGLSINGNNYYITDNNPITSDKVLNGYQVYTKGYQPITGTMPNNGELTYTPTTSEQTIPTGYTSGGTISAVTSAIDENITPENIKKDISILGVTGTLESGEDKLVRKFNEKLFKDNNLDLWEKYSEEVVQKGKSGYVKITMPKGE